MVEIDVPLLESLLDGWCGELCALLMKRLKLVCQVWTIKSHRMKPLDRSSGAVWKFLPIEAHWSFRKLVYGIQLN